MVAYVSSVVASAGGDSAAAYSATKDAVESLSRALACELASHGIRVNSIAPMAVLMPMNERLREKSLVYLEHSRDSPPVCRCGTVDDIAPAAVFLASGDVAFVHGARLAIDGGWSAR